MGTTLIFIVSAVLFLFGRMMSSVDPVEWVHVSGKVAFLDLRNNVCTINTGKRYVLGVPSKSFFTAIKNQNEKEWPQQDKNTVMLSGILEKQEKILGKS